MTTNGAPTTKRRRSPTLRKACALSMRVEPELAGALRKAAAAGGRTVSEECGIRLQRSLALEPRLVTRTVVEPADGTPPGA